MTLALIIWTCLTVGMIAGYGLACLMFTAKGSEQDDEAEARTWQR